MKLYDILKDFPGSQDGRFTEHFAAGTQAALSDYLAGIVVPLGWARPVSEKKTGRTRKGSSSDEEDGKAG